MKKSIPILLAFVLAGALSAFAADYFPLVQGNVWSYDVKNLVNNVEQDMGTATWTITGDTVYGGETYFVVEVLGLYAFGPLTFPDTSELYLKDDGNDIYLTTNLASATALAKAGQHDYVGGEQWTSGTQTVTAVDAGTRDAAGESFSACIGLAADADTLSIFAPDVGPMKMKLEAPVSGNTMTLFFYLTGYDVTVPPPAGIASPAPQRGGMPQGIFTADNASQTISFDLGDSRNGRLSVYRTDGRLVKEYEIGGMGTVAVDRNSVASGNVLLRLMMDGKSYTGRLLLK